jgi:hypothetical protein
MVSSKSPEKSIISFVLRLAERKGDPFFNPLFQLLRGPSRIVFQKFASWLDYNTILFSNSTQKLRLGMDRSC